MHMLIEKRKKTYATISDLSALDRCIVVIRKWLHKYLLTCKDDLDP